MDDRPSILDGAINPFRDGPSRIRRALKPRNFRRWAGRTTEVVALATLFTASSVVGIVLHLDTGQARRVASSAVNDLLAPVLRGRIELGEIESLSLRGARIKSARIYDHRGDQVVYAEGIEARIQTVRLLRALFLESEEIPLVFPRARIENARVTLRPDSDGIPTIASAFLPADPTPSVGPQRPIVIHLPNIEVDEAHADGSVGAPIAADVEQVSASVYIKTDERVSVDVDETFLRARELIPGETSGVATFHLFVDLTPPSNAVTSEGRTVMWTAFEGSIRPLTTDAVAAVDVSAQATMTDGILEGVLRIPRLKSETRAELFEFVPLERDVSGQVRVFGPVTAFDIEGSFEVEQPDSTATIVATGALRVNEDVRLGLHLSAAELDARSIVAAAPSILVDGQAEILVKLKSDEDPLVHVEASTEPTLLAGERIPAIDAVIDVVRGEIIGSVSIDEQDMFLRGSFGMKDGAARFHAHTEVEDLSKLPWITGMTRGKAAVWLNGSFADGELEGNVRGNATNFALRDDSLRVNHVGFSGTFAGTPERPRLKAGLHAEGARALGEELDRITITMEGGIDEPTFTVGVSDRERGELKVSGTINPAQKRARNVAFELQREGEVARGRVGEAGIVDGGFIVRDLGLASPTLGSLGGSVSLVGDEVIGDLRGDDVDITRLGQLLGVTFPVDGRANVALSVVKTPRGRKGHIDLELEDARVLVLGGVGLRVSAELDGDVVKAAGYLRLVDHAAPGARAAGRGRPDTGPLCDGSIIELRAGSIEGTIRGPLLDLETWKDATGAADIVFDASELHCVVQRIPKLLRPLALARGEVAGGFKIKRDPGEKYPSLEDFHVGTDGLELMTNDGALGSDALDLAIIGSLEGDTGLLSVKATVFDERALFQAELKSNLNLDTLATSEDTWATIQEVPTSISIGMPTRSLSTLSSLPYPIREYLPDFEGDFAFLASMGGSLRSPTILVGAQAFNITAADQGQLSKDWIPPITMDATALYDPVRGRGQLGVSLGVNRLPVASLNIGVDLDKAVLIGEKTLEESPWRGDARAEFYELPLHAFPALTDLEIAGALSGTVDLKNLNQNPSAVGELIVPALRVQDRYQRVLVKAEIKEKAAEEAFSVGSTQLEISSVSDKEQSKLQVLGTAAFSWAGLAIPELQIDQPGTLAIGAKDFSIGVFYPAVQGVMSKLDGTLNGDATVAWGSLGDTQNGLFKSADFTLTDGVAYIDQFGQELWAAKATLKADPVQAGGLQDLRLEGVEAQGASGRVHGFATATMRGLSLEKAVGALIIDEGEELPVTVEGVPLGKARADVAFDLAPTPRGFDVNVDVKSAHFELPASSTKDVQSLDEPKNITINKPKEPKKEARDEDATHYKLIVSIADTEVASSMLNLKLGTPPGRPLQLLLSDRMHASGDVILDGGSIVLNKKTFEIDEAIVRLRDEEIGNPYVNLSAHWDGSAGTRVFVTYTGLLSPITDDKLSFRSDPPRSDAEIVQLLIFGDNEATGAALAGDVIGGNVATSLANDLLASAFGGALRDVLALNVGTSAAGGYVGAKVSLSESFSFGGTVEQATDSSTTGSASTSSSTNSTSSERAGGCGDLYFDYKFSRSWSIRGSGAYCDYESTTNKQNGLSLGLDVLWQIRY